MASVASKYGVTPQLLAQLNGVTDHAKLRTGRTLLVPPAPAVTVAVAAASPQAAAASAAATSAASSEGEAANVYVVRRGESISEITKRTGLSEAQILKINKLKNPNYIYEGQSSRWPSPARHRRRQRSLPLRRRRPYRLLPLVRRR